jgi:formate hydrogenlyase subunit 3/multisubunit Na+/H+ antiporter MnhD subunit
LALSLVSVLALIPALQRGVTPAFALPWAPQAGIELDVHLDWLTLPFLLTETGVSLVAVIYAWGYHHVDDRSPVFYALLLLFGLGMSGTTLADDMVLFYAFWELMLVASSLLILMWGEGGAAWGHHPQILPLHPYGIAAGVGRPGHALRRDRQRPLLRVAGGRFLAPAQVSWLILLFVIGFGVKMAIFPLHLWLPDAHTVAPMPVTIMLAAAMLSMGTYGILRFPFSLFSRAQLQPFATPLMIAGVLSAIYGALMALAEQDIKRVVAYSSVSQMGYILLGLGTLTANGIVGATLHVIYHAIVKALLFMALGLVIHATGKRRLRELGGLGRVMPATAVCAGVGALAIAGTPPFCIFDSEWLIFSGAFATPAIALAVVALLGSLLTVAYALWLMGSVFLGAAPAPGKRRINCGPCSRRRSRWLRSRSSKGCFRPRVGLGYARTGATSRRTLVITGDVGVVLPMMCLAGGAFGVYLVAHWITSRNKILALGTTFVLALALAAQIWLGVRVARGGAAVGASRWAR